MSAPSPTPQLLAVGRVLGISGNGLLALRGGGGQAVLSAPHSTLWLAVAALADKERALAFLVDNKLERPRVEEVMTELLKEGWLLEPETTNPEQARLLAQGVGIGYSDEQERDMIALGGPLVGLSQAEFALWSASDGVSLAESGRLAGLEPSALWTVASSLLERKAVILDWKGAR